MFIRIHYKGVLMFITPLDITFNTQDGWLLEFEEKDDKAPEGRDSEGTPLPLQMVDVVPLDWDRHSRFKEVRRVMEAKVV